MIRAYCVFETSSVFSVLQEIVSLVEASDRCRRPRHRQRHSAFLASVAFGATSPTRRDSQGRGAHCSFCFGRDSPVLCIVVHNLEAASIRPYQSLLSFLASQPKVNVHSFSKQRSKKLLARASCSFGSNSEAVVQYSVVSEL